MHDISIPDCPYLPRVDTVITAAATRDLGNDRGARFYEAALGYAQSLWKEGLPARSLLLINRALGSDLRNGEPILEAWPLPYAAVAWILLERRPDQFIGNPRRHWQHLATRMVAPRKEIRTWRAWGCWYLSRLVMPALPADEIQIAREGIVEPEFLEIREGLVKCGLEGEADRWESVAHRFPRSS